MFTGIVTGQGTVRAIAPIGGGQDMRLMIGVPAGWADMASIPLGASIACSGCCLTAIELVASTPAELDAFIRNEMTRWAPLIHKLGIKGE